MLRTLAAPPAEVILSRFLSTLEIWPITAGAADHAVGLVHRETYIQAEAAESPNDRNDRAIRVATAWYMKRIPGKEVFLLTADADNRRKAVAEGLRALSVQAGAFLAMPLHIFCKATPVAVLTCCSH